MGRHPEEYIKKT